MHRLGNGKSQKPRSQRGEAWRNPVGQDAPHITSFSNDCDRSIDEIKPGIGILRKEFIQPWQIGFLKSSSSTSLAAS